MTLEQLQNLLAQMSRVVGAGAGISVRDAQTARVARVLEFGSVAGHAPWPHPGKRTVLAIDPETGTQVVVSAQAPQGFIRAQAAGFLDNLRAGLSQPANWLDAADAQERLDQAMRTAAEGAVARMRAAAPRDSGRFAESLQVVL